MADSKRIEHRELIQFFKEALMAVGGAGTCRSGGGRDWRGGSTCAVYIHTAFGCCR